MDEQVIAAMARWPDVPDVFGWLSLNTQGHWRLHTEGDALADLEPDNVPRQGTSISSSKINQFINRNYAQDSTGQWYFQNGPQRVYVRLDVAPFIFHTVDADFNPSSFFTHNGQRTQNVTRWCLDDAGHLYADTDIGAGLVAGRDLEQVLDKLITEDDESLVDVFERVSSVPGSVQEVRWKDGTVASCHVCRFDQVPALLGFVRWPRARS